MLMREYNVLRAYTVSHFDVLLSASHPVGVILVRRRSFVLPVVHANLTKQAQSTESQKGWLC